MVMAMKCVRHWEAVVAFFLMATLLSTGATALDWEETQKLLASDGAAEDHFGTSVALSGDWALAGAPHN